MHECNKMITFDSWSISQVEHSRPGALAVRPGTGACGRPRRPRPDRCGPAGAQGGHAPAERPRAPSAASPDTYTPPAGTDETSPLSASQLDRAEGVLPAQACGDALGAPWELDRRPADPGCGAEPGEGFMQGGGLGPYAPGEWSDDTQVAVVIARVAATGADLTSRAALDAIANGFIDWLASAASDVGAQTHAVLTSVARHRGEPGVSERMRRAGLPQGLRRAQHRERRSCATASSA